MVDSCLCSLLFSLLIGLFVWSGKGELLSVTRDNVQYSADDVSLVQLFGLRRVFIHLLPCAQFVLVLAMNHLPFVHLHGLFIRLALVIITGRSSVRM